MTMAHRGANARLAVTWCLTDDLAGDSDAGRRNIVKWVKLIGPITATIMDVRGYAEHGEVTGMIYNDSRQLIHLGSIKDPVIAANASVATNGGPGMEVVMGTVARCG